MKTMEIIIKRDEYSQYTYHVYENAPDLSDIDYWFSFNSLDTPLQYIIEADAWRDIKQIGQGEWCRATVNQIYIILGKKFIVQFEKDSGH